MLDLFNQEDVFRHEALPYNGSRAFSPSCAAVVRDGVENEDRVIVLSASSHLDELADMLGPDADDVALIALDQHGRNPARIATMLHTFHAGGNGQRSLGVVDMSLGGRSAQSIAELRFSDAVLNLEQLRSWSLSLVCMFDYDQLEPDGHDSVRHCHAVVRGHDTNVDYEPDLALTLFGVDLEPAPDHAARHAIDGTHLGGVRAFVRHNAEGHGIAADRVDDLVLAANEIVTNSMRYGGGRADLAMWFADGSLVCEVRDTGHLEDPLSGRFAPPPSATSGRGLWLANHLCDLVAVRSAPGRTVVRMFLDT